MTAILLPQGRQRYFGNDGLPLAGGKVWTYAAGTSTPKVAYRDEAGTPWTNPIILDANGEAVIYWDGNYKVNVLASDDTQVTGWPVDNLKTDPLGFAGGIAAVLAALNAFITLLATAAGAALVGFLQTGVGAVLRTLQNRGEDAPLVTDFMTQAQINDARAFGFTLDCSAAFNAALVRGNGAIRVPYGGYVAKNLTIPPGVTIISVEGEYVVNNYYKRANSTVIKTQGQDFIKGGATSMLFCARDIYLESSGQAGMCFGTTSAVETGFYFYNVGFSAFEKGFWAPQYSSSSYAENVSFTDCDYGL